jgi:hypothetical protein
MQNSGAMRRENEDLCVSLVIARSEATKQSRIVCVALDCFAEPVIGPRFARTRWLAILAITESAVGAARKQKTAGALTPPSIKRRPGCTYIPMSKTLGS